LSNPSQQSTSQIKSLESLLNKLKPQLTLEECGELKRHLNYIVNEYGGMEEIIETVMHKTL
jgi:hypothetical protein